MVRKQPNTAFTIVELLVVIAIMGILVVLIVPRIRTVTKERNIREAARTVAALFSKSSQQAVVDGYAGVLLERNQNFLYQLPAANRGTAVATEVPYSSNTLYMLRAVPPFSGDYANDPATVSTSIAGPLTITTVSISIPLNHDEGNGKFFIRPRDVIFLGNQQFGYKIVSVVENGTMLDLVIDTFNSDPTDVRPSFPVPIDATGIPYRIRRQPRKVESSRVVLPDGYMVNLRFSGPVDSTSPYPETILSQFTNTGDTEVRIFLNSTGGIDWIQAGDGFDTVTTVPPPNVATKEDFTIIGTLFLMVCEDNLELTPGADQLTVATNLWITVNQTGNVNVASVVPQNPYTGGLPEEPVLQFQSRLNDSREISRTRQTVTQ